MKKFILPAIVMILSIYVIVRGANSIEQTFITESVTYDKFVHSCEINDGVTVIINKELYCFSKDSMITIEWYKPK